MKIDIATDKSGEFIQANILHIRKPHQRYKTSLNFEKNIVLCNLTHRLNADGPGMRSSDGSGKQPGKRPQWFLAAASL